jgi:hypothetical protein
MNNPLRHNAVKIFVTKVAPAKTLPRLVSERFLETKAEYTMETDVSENAVPAKSETDKFQPTMKYEKIDTNAKGTKNDENPIRNIFLNWSFMKSVSISKPVKNVTNTPPKVARNSIQDCGVKSPKFPIIIPKMTSIIATVIDNLIEIRADIKISKPNTNELLSIIKTPIIAI